MTTQEGLTTHNTPLDSLNTRSRNIRHVEVILKTVERCNLACKYCYFFFADNQTYKLHPPYISRESIREVTSFLKNGAYDCSLDVLRIGLHGGEPMMQKKTDFDWMCSHFHEEFASIKNFEISIQTNATLVDKEWIELFAKHKVRIGVSIDGPEEDNDLFRIDHFGRGTHARTVEGIRLLMEAAHAGKVGPIGSLCVVNPLRDPKSLFKYFASEIGLKRFDFLLPQTTTHSNPRLFGEYFCRLFDAWIEYGNPDIEIRFFHELFSKFRGRSSFSFPNGTDPVTFSAFKISSDARLYPDDVLYDESWYTPHVNDTGLKLWLENDVFRELDSLGQNLPAQCEECCWSKICGGGHPWNRFSKENGFHNPSSLCEGLKLIYAHICEYMLSIGIPRKKIYSVLGFEPQKDDLHMNTFISI